MRVSLENTFLILSNAKDLLIVFREPILGEV